MRHKHKFTPYIRRYKPGDKSESMRVAYQMAFHNIYSGGRYYVMLQRGFPGIVVAAARTRELLEHEILWLNIRKRYGARFKHYAKATRMQCAGTPMPRDWPPKRYDSGRYGKSLKGKGPDPK